MNEAFKEFAERVIQAKRGIGGFVAVSYDESEPHQPVTSWMVFRSKKYNVVYEEDYIDISTRTYCFSITDKAVIEKVPDDHIYYFPKKPEGYARYKISNPNDNKFCFWVSILDGKRLFHHD